LSRNGPSVDESDLPSEEVASKKKPGQRLQTSRLNITATVEKNPENLNAVKLDHEYSFDPMFQKMSKAFDEGGAKGMLLYNMVRHMPIFFLNIVNCAIASRAHKRISSFSRKTN
jgi:hypothetical protein